MTGHDTAVLRSLKANVTRARRTAAELVGSTQTVEQRLAEKLASIRADAGVKQDELAGKVGVKNGSAICRREKSGSLTVAEFAKHCDALGVPPDEVLRDVLSTSRAGGTTLQSILDRLAQIESELDKLLGG